MISRYIKSFASASLDPEREKEELAALIEGINKRAARRMSILGKLMWHVLRDVPLNAQTSLVYGTTFTEARALEQYLESFPYASPTAFQTSIHPGGVEQALIMEKRDVGPLFPMAGESGLLSRLLVTALTSDTPMTVVCGGEERGTWLADFNLASPVSFAFSLCLCNHRDDAVGSIVWEPESSLEPGQQPAMSSTIGDFEKRNPVSLAVPGHGKLTITWS